MARNGEERCAVLVSVVVLQHMTNPPKRRATSGSSSGAAPGPIILGLILLVPGVLLARRTPTRNADDEAYGRRVDPDRSSVLLTKS